MIDLNVLFSTLIGSIGGAFAIFFINFLSKTANQSIKQFKDALGIQLDLNQLLDVLLDLYESGEVRKQEFLKIYRDQKQPDPEKTWHDFKFIEIPELPRTLRGPHLDWDFSQFLSRKKGEGRKILSYIMDARHSFQEVMGVIDIRNKMVSRAHKLLADADQKINIYEDENLKKIIQEPLFTHLTDTTTCYEELLVTAIKSVHTSFKKMEKYIEQEFSQAEPLRLNIAKKYKALLDEILAN